MKIRNTEHREHIVLQMTPMIDIVFQLLVFFVFTFKIVLPEGDFNIRRAGTGGSDKPNLPPEFSSEKHVRGVVSMARAASPASANSQFFIMLGDSDWLDNKYSVWGKVTSGMEFVDKIKKGGGSNGAVDDPDTIRKLLVEQVTAMVRWRESVEYMRKQYDTR